MNFFSTVTTVFIFKDIIFQKTFWKPIKWKQYFLITFLYNNNLNLSNKNNKIQEN